MRRLAFTVCALVLAAPAPALAQSAGDNQYQDPFANGSSGSSPGSSSPGSPSSGSTSSSGTSGQSASTSPQTASTSPVGTRTGSPSSSAPASQAREGTPTPAGELPRTGRDALLQALAGAGLVLAGVGVRLRARG